MSKHVKCSFCGDMKWMQYRYFKENLMNYQAENIDQLNKVYLCRECRIYLEPNHLKRTPKFKQFQKELQEIINEYILRGWNNPEAERFCHLNVVGLLEKHHIGPNEFKVVRDGHKIKGFILMNIPLWHEVLVEINWKEKI